VKNLNPEGEFHMKRMNLLVSVFLTMMLIMAACSSGNNKNDSMQTNSPSESASNSESASASESTKPEEKVKITFMHWDGGAAKDSLEKAIKSFMEINKNIEVKLEFTPRDQYDQKINAMIAAGSPPDISYVPEALSIKWGLAGTLADVSPLLDQDPDMRGDMVATYSHEGKTYGMMTTAEIMILYYNKQMFTDAGLEPPSADGAHPWTWDQFLDAAHKLTTDADGKHSNEAGFNKNKTKTYGAIVPTWWGPVEPLMKSNEGGYAAEDGLTPLVSSDATIEVVQKIADLVNKELVSPNAAQAQSLQDAPNMMKNNQLGMYIGGQWENNAFKSIGYDVGYAAIPMFKKPVNIVLAASTSIYEKSTHKEEAWKLVKFLMDPEANLSMHQEGYWMPISKKWYTDENLIKKWTDNDIHDGNYLKLVQSSMLGDNIVQIPYVMNLINWDKIDLELGARFGKVYAGEKSAKDALDGADEKIKPLLQGFYH
jgi:multiple sugar transport system substrate-binding protein